MSRGAGSSPGDNRRAPRSRSKPANDPLRDRLWDLLYECGQAGVSSSSYPVLVALALQADIDGTIRASIRGIARHVNLSPGTTQRHISRLVEFGFVEQLGGDRANNSRRIWRIPAMDQSDG